MRGTAGRGGAGRWQEMISNIIESSIVICLVLGLAILLIVVAFDLHDTWVETLGAIALGYVVFWILIVILVLALNGIWGWF
jgi:hypothetical protein